MTVRIPPNNTSSNSKVFTIDFRETAPVLSNSSMYVSNPNSSRYGGLAVGVPGEVRGLEEAHQRWGTMPWQSLIKPSISLAEGWEVDKELGRRLPVRADFIHFYTLSANIASFQWFSDLMLNNPDWSSIFAPQGRLLKEGEIIRRTNLSRTLKKISEEGANAFYTVFILHFHRVNFH